MASDAVLLNSVQKGLNDWKKAILSVTRLDRDVSSGDAMTEINFWLSMDAALNRIQAQLKSPEIGLYLSFISAMPHTVFVFQSCFLPSTCCTPEQNSRLSF